MTSDADFSQLLEAPEGAHLEFKEANHKYSIDKLTEYCVALANEGGGKIILGVTDKRPRTVVGTRVFPDTGNTESIIYQKLSRRVSIEEKQSAGKRVLIIHVPPRDQGDAWSINGLYLKRAGDSLVGISMSELRTMLDEKRPDFSSLICENAKIEDLDPASISIFKTSWSRKSSNERIRKLSDKAALTDAELIVDEGITYAALILLGTPAALGKHLPAAEIIFEFRSNEASGPAQAREERRAGFLSCHDELWKLIDLRNDKQSYQDGLLRHDIKTFDEASIREGVLNAIAHRDYREPGSIFVKQYPRRLEIISPGGFPPGIDVDNILDKQNPRNRRLSEALSKCGLVERSGQGVNLLFEQAIKNGKQLPNFSGSSASEVKLTIDGFLSNPAFVKFLEKLGAEKTQSLSTYDFLALAAIANDSKSMSAQAKTRLQILANLGAIEKTGRGRGVRYILSPALYRAIGKPGTYTRKVGLDDSTNKALLLKHISSNGGAPLSELHQVLPNLTRVKVRRLLNELRKDHQVEISGLKRAAKWVIRSGFNSKTEP